MSTVPGTFPEDLERAPLVLEDQAPVEIAPRKEPDTPGEWVRQNLFSSRYNGALTVVTAAVVGYVAFRLVRWILVTAEWGVVKANLQLYMIGRFPVAEAWRVWVSVYLVALLAGLTWGATGTRLRWTRRTAALRAAVAALLVGGLLYLLEGVRIWVLVLAAVLIVGGGVLAGRAAGRRALRAVAAAWIPAFGGVILVLRGFDGVPPSLWGGFVLNVLVAVVGIVLSFPFGILLAIGRRSSLRAISVFCVGFIELIRGVPLVTLIIAGQFILPLMLPPGMQLADIVRAMLMFTIFSSAYVAEIVRGGLQGVDAGQYEAGRALGLSTTRLMALVVLPQALRSTIPSMISHFISLFKDTSLLAVLAITDLLRAARRASAQLTFIGDQKEALFVAALIFWAVAFTMSRWSQRLERRVGVGER